MPPAKKLSTLVWMVVTMFVVPIAYENVGAPSASVRQLLSNLGRRLADISGESRETSYLFQRCPVLVVGTAL